MAKIIVYFCYSIADRNSIRTVAIDGFEQFELNPDYTMSEYFKELAKECRSYGINFLYVLNMNIQNKKEFYHELPEVYEQFSDTITVLK